MSYTIKTVRCNSYRGDNTVAVFALLAGEKPLMGNQVHNVHKEKGYYQSDRFGGCWKDMEAVKRFTAEYIINKAKGE